MCAAKITTTELMARFGIGLTGGVATGKSTVARMIAEEGHPVFDADVLSKRVMQPDGRAYQQVVSVFGKDFLLPDGSLNRPKLRETIFSNAAMKKKLEAIVHVEIRKQLAEELEAAGLMANPGYWFYEAALLVETGSANQFYALWVTWCEEDLQLQRLMLRESISEDAARAYLANQMPALAKANVGDLVIDTSGDFNSVNQQVKQALSSLPTAKQS